ncbi:MAG: trypsin-like peptidase domain-containing protein, partial [Nitrospinae bacterium]|nr:trypsin-like peptidase domain-containing protein [Nitrospinota bacterium]
MSRINPENNRFSRFAVLFFVGVIGVTVFLDRPVPAPHLDAALPAGENTAYHPFSAHPEYQLILELQKAFVRNAKAISPSVVNISTVKESVDKSSWHDSHSPESQSWLLSLKSWFNRTLRQKKYVSETVGSGVIIDNRGHILTNYHVIKNTRKLLVRLADGRDYFAKVVGADPKTDLAVLKISTLRSLPLPPFGSSREAQVGQWVMAI